MYMPPAPSAERADLLPLPLDLPLLALHGGDQAPPGCDAERLRRAPRLVRRRRRRSELAVRVDEDALGGPGDRRAADALKEGAVLLPGSRSGSFTTPRPCRSCRCRCCD